jgi:hypothetical protein
MASTAAFRATKFGGLTPAMGTYPLAANTFIPKGTLVTINAAGYALGDGSGVRCVGVAAHSANNLTGSEMGGLAGAVSVDTNYGIHEFVIADADVLPGDIVYVVDNQTLTKDAILGGCVAGTFHESASDGKKYANISTLVPAVMGSLQEGRLEVLPSDLRQASGVTAIAFVDGSVDGIVVNEGVMHRWNVASTNARWATFMLPPDLDDARDIVVHALCSREGSADTTAALTVGAFFQTVAAAYTADADAGGASSAVSAATTVVQEVTRTIAAADVPAGPCVLNLSLVPTAALDADDLNLHALWVTFTRKG